MVNLEQELSEMISKYNVLACPKSGVLELDSEDPFLMDSVALLLSKLKLPGSDSEKKSKEEKGKKKEREERGVIF